MDVTELNSERTRSLLQCAASGDQESWAALLSDHRERLRRMVELRMDPRVRARLDASDVIQEASLEAWSRLDEFLAQRGVSFFLWLRFLTAQRLLTLHRRHLGAQLRSAGREVSLDRSGPPATSVALAADLLSREPRPSEAAIQAERQARVQSALEALDETDREILTLRHFEQLTNAEAAEVLALQESAASKRYMRAVRRLQGLLAAPDGSESQGMSKE